MKKFSNIDNLLTSLGGSCKLALRLGVHQFTVERWARQGIPLKYWDTLIKLCDITPAELFAINKKIKK